MIKKYKEYHTYSPSLYQKLFIGMFVFNKAIFFVIKRFFIPITNLLTFWYIFSLFLFIFFIIKFLVYSGFNFLSYQRPYLWDDVWWEPTISVVTMSLLNDKKFQG